MGMDGESGRERQRDLQVNTKVYIDVGECISKRQQKLQVTTHISVGSNMLLGACLCTVDGKSGNVHKWVAN